MEINFPLIGKCLNKLWGTMQSLKTVSASKRTDPQKSVQDKLLIEKIKIHNITYIYIYIWYLTLLKITY